MVTPWSRHGHIVTHSLMENRHISEKAHIPAIEELMRPLRRMDDSDTLPGPYRVKEAKGRPQDIIRDVRCVRPMMAAGIYAVFNRPKVQSDFKETDSSKAKRSGCDVADVRKERYENSDGSRVMEPVKYLSHFYKHGDTYDGKMVLSQEGIVESQQITDVCNRREKLPCAVVLKDEKKNGNYWFQRMAKDMFPDGYTDGTDDKRINRFAAYQQPDYFKCPIGPRGGNGTQQAAHGSAVPGASNSSTIGKADGTVDIDGYPQFKHGVKHKSVFALFAPVRWFDPSYDSPSLKDRIIFFGFFYFAQYHHIQNIEDCGDFPNTSRKRYFERMWDPDDPATEWAREEADNAFVVVAPIYDRHHPIPDHVKNHRPCQNAFNIYGDEKIALCIHDMKQYDNIKYEGIITKWIETAIQDVDPTGKEDITCTLHNGSRCTVSGDDFVKHLGRIGVAGFARYLRHNIYDGQVGYLSGDKFSKLGEVLNSRYVESPNRCLNMVTLTLLLDSLPCEDGGFVRERLTPEDTTSVLRLKELIFKATVLRCAPTAGYYILFNRWMTIHESSVSRKDFATMVEPITSKDSIRVPSMADAASFVEFLAFCSTNGGSSSMAKFTKVLHDAALLDCAKSTIENFGSFLQRYIGELNKLFEKDWSKWSRDQWIRNIDGMFKQLCNPLVGKSYFIASLVVLDVEEILIDPFGKPELAWLGFGGIRGIAMLDIKEDDDLPDVPIPDDMTKKDYHHMRVCLMLLEALKRAPPDVLRGLAFEMRDNDLINLVNNSIIDIRHIDHIICKVSYNETMTTGARLVSIFPSLSQSYGWPVNENISKVYNNIAPLHRLAKKAVSVLDRRTGGDDYIFGTIPKCLTFEGEWNRREALAIAFDKLLSDNQKRKNTATKDSTSKTSSSVRRKKRAAPVKKRTPPRKKRKPQRKKRKVSPPPETYEPPSDNDDDGVSVDKTREYVGDDDRYGDDSEDSDYDSDAD